MSWDQLKAYLQNPDIALERMKRLAPSEGQRMQDTREQIQAFDKVEPSNEQVAEEIAMQDQALDMASGMAGTAKSAAQMLKEAPASKWGKLVVKDTAPKSFGQVRRVLGK